MCDGVSLHIQSSSQPEEPWRGQARGKRTKRAVGYNFLKDAATVAEPESDDDKFHDQSGHQNEHQFPFVRWYPLP